MAKAKTRRRRMTAKPKSNSSGYVLKPVKRPSNPEHIPASKADIERLINVVEWPPTFMRNKYGQKMKEIYDQLYTLPHQKGLSFEDFIHQHNKLSADFDTASRNLFSENPKLIQGELTQPQAMGTPIQTMRTPMITKSPVFPDSGISTLSPQSPIKPSSSQKFSRDLSEDTDDVPHIKKIKAKKRLKRIGIPVKRFSLSGSSMN